MEVQECIWRKRLPKKKSDTEGRQEYREMQQKGRVGVKGQTRGL